MTLRQVFLDGPRPVAVTPATAAALAPLVPPQGGALVTIPPQEALPAGVYQRAAELLNDVRAHVAAGLAKKGPLARPPRVDSWLNRHQETFTAVAGGIAAVGAIFAALSSQHDPGWLTASFIGVAAAGFTAASYIARSGERLSNRAYRNRGTDLTGGDVEAMLRALSREDQQAAALIGPAVAQLFLPVESNLTSEGHAIIRRLRESVASVSPALAAPATRAATVFAAGIKLLRGRSVMAALPRLSSTFAEASPNERRELAAVLEQLVKPESTYLLSDEKSLAELKRLMDPRRERSVD